MLAAGVRCTKAKLDWAVVEGSKRASAKVVEHR